MTQNARIADLLVVGGGPAGLARAFWEQRLRPHESARIQVLEARDAPGGWMRSERTDDGFLLERGPQTVRGSVEFDDLLEALDLDDELLIARPESTTRWLARRDRLHRLPRSPLGLVTGNFLPLGARLRLLAEPMIRAPRLPDDAESLASFVRRRLGRGAVGLVQAMVSGVHAGDIEQLEVRAAFPSLAKFERESGSLLRGALAQGRKRRSGKVRATRRRGILGFENGLQRLTDALVQAIGDDRIECDEAVATIDRTPEGHWLVGTHHGSHYRARRLVLAIRAREAGRLLMGLDSELACELGFESCSTVVSVWFGFPLDAAESNPRMRGFGFLQHGDEPGPLLGCLYSGRVFPNTCAPGHGLLRAMLGGARFASMVENASNEEVVAMADQRLRKLLRYDGPWTMTEVRRATHAIPHYTIGHTARVARIRDYLAKHWQGCLDLIGCSYEHLALPGQFGKPS